jgi:hypothetical protein
VPGAANLPDDFKRILRKAELPNIRYHELYHSAASLRLALNVHSRIVMELLGYSQISLTMDAYGHVVPDVLRDVVGKLRSGPQRGLADSCGCQISCIIWQRCEKCLIFVVAGEGFEPSTSGL